MRSAVLGLVATLSVSACLVDQREDEGHGVGGDTAGATGGTSGTGSGGRGGRGGETGGTSGTAGTGAGGTGGASGTGACVENIGCELDPPPSTGDVHQDCVNRINQFRSECACLPPLARWTDGEACANQMAEYDSTQDTAHAGFRDDICSGGFAQNECPSWGSEVEVIDGCLQSMWDEGPPPTASCNNACFQMYGHFINMTNPDYTKVACGFYTTAGGETWAVQNYSP